MEHIRRVAAFHNNAFWYWVFLSKLGSYFLWWVVNTVKVKLTIHEIPPASCMSLDNVCSSE
jgi:hypothetical protein